MGVVDVLKKNKRSNEQLKEKRQDSLLTCSFWLASCPPEDVKEEEDFPGRDVPF